MWRAVDVPTRHAAPLSSTTAIADCCNCAVTFSSVFLPFCTMARSSWSRALAMVWWPVRTASAGVAEDLGGERGELADFVALLHLHALLVHQRAPGICSTCCKVINSAWVCPRVFHALSEGWMRL